MQRTLQAKKMATEASLAELESRVGRDADVVFGNQLLDYAMKLAEGKSAK